jgi:branched-chain amino acid transport system substrate-binding protein
MNRRRSTAMVALVSALALVTAACGGGDDGGGSAGAGGGGGDCTWVVGTMGALSGDLATIGQPIFEGIEYGVDVANEDFDLGCELVLEEEDSQGLPDKAPQLAQSLAQNEETVAVVGPYFSGETEVAGEIFNEAGIPMLTPSATNPTLSENGWDTFFRLVGTDSQQAQEAADFLTEVQGLETVAVMHDNSEYGKPLAEGVADELGNALTGELVAINPEETDFSAQISQVKQTGADGVFFGGYQPEFSEIIKQGTDAGFDVQYVSGDGSKAPEVAEDPSAEGSVVLCPCDDPAVSKASGAKEFASGFEEATGGPPGTYAVEGFDGVQFIATALEEGGYDADTDVAQIREELTSYFAENSYEGISKTFSFDENGEIGKVAIFAYEVKNGAIEQLGLVADL